MVEAATARRPCPICRRPATAEHHPFCSRRCANVDLGRWLGGHYAIPGEEVPKDDDGDGPDGRRG
jgi:endogenous inhibitor of DNA gyrase (YacG/DUF329 family)